MRFRSYDGLRLFDVVAHNGSFTAAAVELNLSKGAVSYQIKQLEQALGFALFHRGHRGITLTDKGRTLWHASHVAFRDLDQEIARLRADAPGRITIGMSTYFASRWLSPRLMRFTASHPRIPLRLQPLTDLFDLQSMGIDLAIRWGNGAWRDMEIEPLFTCPAFPTAGKVIAQRAAEGGLAAVLTQVPLLHDRDGSTAWSDWHEVAGLPFTKREDDLVIPDPNVRVQAVIDGQGVAINDALVAAELAAGQLIQVSWSLLADYGYFLAYPPGAMTNPSLKAFCDWIREEASNSTYCGQLPKVHEM